MNIKKTIKELGRNAKTATQSMKLLSTQKKNIALRILSKNIQIFSQEILDANKKDIENANTNSLSAPLINRLTLTPQSIEELIKSIAIIETLPDPIGKILDKWTQPNGLKFQKISVPLGVIAVIYESRPIVTVDAACIAMKSGNAVILRGGSDSFFSSKKFVEIIIKSFLEADLPAYAIQMIPTADRDAVDYLVKMKEYVDIIIPRGGKNLIEKINSQSSIPVIKHLDGICHVYIDNDADMDKAKKVLFNSKMRRPEICGATETLLIDQRIKDYALTLLQPLIEANCEIRGDKYIYSLHKNFVLASEYDWSTDILDIYELEINPDNENQYKFDNKWVDLESFDVKINIKTTGKLYYPHTEKAYWSIHGPVIKGKKATYAIKYSSMGDIRIIEQWYKMNKSNNFNEWIDAMKMNSIPMFNSGYADKDGNIFYIYGANFPLRNENYNWKKVLPGNTSKTLWDEYLPFEKLPQLLNPKSGFIQNCNNTPYMTTIGKDNIKKEEFSNTLGIEGHMTNRALRALETFGNDNKISYDEFKKYKFDLKYSDNSSMKQFVDRGLKLLSSNNFKDFDSATIIKAKEIFTNWDLSTDINNINVALPVLTFGKYIDVNPDDLSDEKIIEQLISSISHLMDNFNKLDIDWGSVNRLIRGDINLPVSGAPDISRAIYTKKGLNGQLKAIAGDCYILLTKWNKNNTHSSESIHQYGSSTKNLNSKHYNDQSKLFSENKFKKIYINIDDLVNTVESIQILK